MGILELPAKEPSFKALKELIHQHLTRIPFENISKIYYKLKYNLNYKPDFERYLEGIRQYNFGGTCYSNNCYFNQLLNYLGYNAMLCGADMSSPDVHIVNVVKIDKKEYLVDVGYGAPFFEPVSLNLNSAHFVCLGNLEYIFHPKDKSGYIELKMFQDGKLKHGYIVKPVKRSIEDFDYVIKDSFREAATFLNSILLVKFNKSSGTMINNFSLIELEEERTKKTILKNKSDLVEKISIHLGIPPEIAEESLTSIKNFGDSWN